ncbi:MAG TPA: hypothetical protein VJV23_10705 [Candidatus Polarisedimenticolia bacterium]|nr:hypothetical protein [Candidatus Polarisedimenticolia bacterium]
MKGVTGGALLLSWCLAAGSSADAAPQAAPRPGSPGPSTGTLPNEARIRPGLSLLLELHHYLHSQATGLAVRKEDYRDEIATYAAVRAAAPGADVWRLVNDACVEGPDAKALLERSADLPAQLGARDREAARRLLEALAAAWPRFESGDMIERNRSLQKVRTAHLTRGFSGALEERIMSTVYGKMLLVPLQQRITVYPVIATPAAGDWGRTAQGYYLVVSATGGPLLETLVHELTHVIDINQPAGSRSMLRRLQEEGRGADPEALDRMVHGLVVWNAAEMVKRFAHAGYKASFPSWMGRYMATYEGPWAGYLDGKLTAEQAIEGILGALKPAAPPAPRQTRLLPGRG